MAKQSSPAPQKQLKRLLLQSASLSLQFVSLVYAIVILKISHQPPTNQKCLLPMAHLKIDIQHNSIEIKNGADFMFNRRWEASLLVLLLQAASKSLSLTVQVINESLLLRGQLQPLNRAQLKRLFQNLDQFLISLPGQPGMISTPPRKSTVGPWSLILQSSLTFEIVGEKLVKKHSPTLLLVPHVDHLHQLLTHLLISDAFAVHGDYRSAIEAIQLLHTLTLTPEGRCMVWMREAMWHKRLGNYDIARELTNWVITTNTPADPGLQSHALFFLHRITYDASPAAAVTHLWEATVEPPPAGHADWRTLAEWHNLRALLTRRRLQTLAQLPQATPTSDKETPESLNRDALLHFESALYFGAWQRDWDRLQAYVANLAYHVQSVFALNLAGRVNIQQVFSWHRLTLAYSEKLESARDSAWEYIFLGSFWLEHHAELVASKHADALGQEIDGSNPANEVFYIRAIRRLKECADARQIAIGYTMYLRFAKNHMSGTEKHLALHTACKELSGLLSQQPAMLMQTLHDEGYTTYWPSELQALA